MFKSLKVLAGVAALSVAVAGQVQAQTLTYSGDACNTAVTVPAYDFCEGIFEGNDNNQQSAVLSFIEGWLGQTNVQRVAGVEDYEGIQGGPISFGAEYSKFVLSMKLANSFGLYYYEGPLSGIESFATYSGQDLSHWNIYQGEVSVPEPASMLLLGTGILGLAMARRRRDDEV